VQIQQKQVVERHLVAVASKDKHYVGIKVGYQHARVTVSSIRPFVDHNSFMYFWKPYW
jgi:hypothetical protein